MPSQVKHCVSYLKQHIEELLNIQVSLLKLQAEWELPGVTRFSLEGSVLKLRKGKPNTRQGLIELHIDYDHGLYIHKGSQGDFWNGTGEPPPLFAEFLGRRLTDTP